MREYAHELEWIPTGDVIAGDRMACLLSDAEAYPVVTGWQDRTLDLTRYDLGVKVHRTFTARYAPWWVMVGTKDDMMTADLGRETLIVKRAV